jgi:fatty-acyl-CoA synthase
LDEKPYAIFPSLFNDLAEQYGDNIALVSASEQLSYRDLAQRARQYARWALAQGLSARDVVCLLMPNCAEYVALWLGITQTGCAVALLNTNLAGHALLHCISAAGSTRIIVGQALLPSIAGIVDRLPGATQCWVYGESDSMYPRIDLDILEYSSAPIALDEARRPTQRDRALLIYTSGTTGLPKAANVTHGRIVEWSYWFAGMMDVQQSDRLYDCLPMYHSTGGIVAIGAMLVKGGSVFIRERFSASRFWDDVVDGQCTIFQYIGELCRYLLHSERHPRETQHKLRLCCGNGLRGDVWEGFQSRFGIGQILEFYAATEGSVSLYNCEGKPGAIGRVPAFLAHRFPVSLVKYDVDTGEVMRDAAGFCIRCAPGETGEAIGKIVSAENSPARQFDGYTDADASERKMLRDVFTDGDCWFRTGDLMRRDRAGYYYFIDRAGDTFRWKGENVSTTEVASVVEACPGVTEAVVFGVAVPGYEGRAGMAAITIDANFSPAVLRAHLAENLPEYARPIFIRICQSLEITGTFKLKKDKLLREGYAAPSAPDRVWFYDRQTNDMIACDEAFQELMMSGVTRL